MKRIINIFAILVTAAGFTSCEDVIDLDIPKGKTFAVVDAWITNEAGKQSIRITETVPYTSTGTAPVVSDAVVVLTDLTDNKTYPFTFANGVYSHDPGLDKSIGVLNHAYKLRIELKSQVFEAIDTIKRVPEIDSISYEFKTEENSASNKEGYYARFHGRDLAGASDYYWVRSYRNTKDNRVGDAFAVDGSYQEYVSDSAVFIVPISESITNWDKPFQLNETVIVRLASLTKSSHTFLTHVESQLQNGGLFAKILENVKSNLKNTNASSDVKVLGWFGTSAVKFKEKTIR
ncbi:DUF4249 domain-containing protein [Chitinophaga niabensis]|uniref:DUF4249 domain-containing protein n=1 Tax=Chitinophaga niabensis TaxID=536979 RepID=A0A1N6FQI9_9BACT|nr:DUF4249 domain-containing protein [Chitinophaga niabensis]SIN97566.1 protein of unknown function [Chitinophaga niabensis]